MFRAGMKVKVVSGVGAYHSIPHGTVITLTSSKGDGSWNTSHGNYVRNEHIAMLTQTKADVEADIKQLQDELKDAEAKLTYMESVGSKEFNETEWKVYRALMALGSDATMSDKAAVIAKLINQ